MDALLQDILKATEVTPRQVDKDRIIKAFEFASLAHTGQTRLSGEAFITHPSQVAKTLALWNLDTTAIVAGLLHDTVENGGATAVDIQKEFGEDVWHLVDGVTTITNIHLTGSFDESFVENLRKMLLVMAKDLRVVLIKLADRLHNLQTLQYLSKDRQYINAKETLAIYAPLAERLGMGEIKGQMEDLSFPYVYPEEAKRLAQETKKLYQAAEKSVDVFRRELLILLANVPGVVVNVRRKHLYSLWKKLQRPEIENDISKIHDLVAARVLVNTPDQCYVAMGLIHGKYHPVPYLGVSDFIANPKPNGYRSIHTKVFGPDGKIVEIQIRTQEMHQQAEMGIAAHWNYSLAKAAGASDTKLEKGLVSASADKLAWVKQLMSWQQEISDDDQYLKLLQFDALAHRNLVFSPIGDVYDLPQGATPIDYAFAVHTALGNQASGAKVNGKLVPLNQSLKNGDVVEIIIDRKRTKPNHEWLEFVVTNTARHHILKSLKP